MPTLQKIRSLLDANLIPIPLKPNTKIPLTTNWPKTQRNEVIKNFKNFKKVNVGLVCGKCGDLTVIDVDIYKDDVAHKPTLEWYNKYKDELNKTRTVKTCSGNTHHYYRYTPDLTSCNLRNKGLKIK